jgi:hypothetical protein
MPLFNRVNDSFWDVRIAQTWQQLTLGMSGFKTIPGPRIPRERHSIGHNRMCNIQHISMADVCVPCRPDVTSRPRSHDFESKSPFAWRTPSSSHTIPLASQMNGCAHWIRYGSGKNDRFSMRSRLKIVVSLHSNLREPRGSRLKSPLSLSIRELLIHFFRVNILSAMNSRPKSLQTHVRSVQYSLSLDVFDCFSDLCSLLSVKLQ